MECEAKSSTREGTRKQGGNEEGQAREEWTGMTKKADNDKNG